MFRKQWSSLSTQAATTAVANTIKAVCDAHTEIATRAVRRIDQIQSRALESLGEEEAGHSGYQHYWINQVIWDMLPVEGVCARCSFEYILYTYMNNL